MMKDSVAIPSIFVAAVVPAILLPIWTEGLTFAAYLVLAMAVFAVSTLIGMFIALPLYVLAVRLGFYAWWSSAIAGCLIAALASGILLNAFDHAPDIALLFYCAIGAGAGLVFWLAREALYRALKQ